LLMCRQDGDDDQQSAHFRLAGQAFRWQPLKDQHYAVSFHSYTGLMAHKSSTFSSPASQVRRVDLDPIRQELTRIRPASLIASVFSVGE
jgi:hypothetical protein